MLYWKNTQANPFFSSCYSALSNCLGKKLKNLLKNKKKKKEEETVQFNLTKKNPNKNIGRQELLAVNPLLPSSSELEASGVLEVSH